MDETTRILLPAKPQYFSRCNSLSKIVRGFLVVEQQAVLTSIMVGSAFIAFVVIFSCHCYKELAKMDVFGHFCAKCVGFVTAADLIRGRGEKNGGEGISDGSTAATLQPQTVSVFSLNDLREPLLDDS